MLMENSLNMVFTCTERGWYCIHIVYEYLYMHVCRDMREGVVTDKSLSGVPVLFIPGNAGSHRQGVCGVGVKGVIIQNSIIANCN